MLTLKQNNQGEYIISDEILRELYNQVIDKTNYDGVYHEDAELCCTGDILIVATICSEYVTTHYASATYDSPEEVSGFSLSDVEDLTLLGEDDIELNYVYENPTHTEYESRF